MSLRLISNGSVVYNEAIRKVLPKRSIEKKTLYIYVRASTETASILVVFEFSVSVKKKKS